MSKRAQVPADQAAGLRRRSYPAEPDARQPFRYIHCISDSSGPGVRLAHALRQIERTLLLVDTRGRHFSASSPRSLFDWKHQLERKQLHTLPQAYGEGWYAPGVQADEPALYGIARGYDHVIFDMEWSQGDLALPAGAMHTVVMEIRRTDESMRNAYTVLKTLACSGAAFSASLLGDRSACDHVQAACCYFLEQDAAYAIVNLANEDDAFAALAVRMAGEERASRLVNNDRDTLTW